MRICVLGTGYVGLVAGACFSDSGNHVVCADVDKSKIDKLDAGQIPIYEPGLEDLVARNVRAKRLRFTNDIAAALADVEVTIVAVGTPQGDDGASNLTYLLAAVRSIRDHAKRDGLVVTKSTVPVGTADRIRTELRGSKAKLEVVSNPEFLKEGAAINDFFRPERVVIGCETAEARRTMADLYAPFVRGGNPILFMSNRSAEMAKYAANTFLAMKISFINDMALLAEKTGADIHDVRRGLVTDSRIGNKFLYPGCGYGGSCFPKDVLALTHLGREVGLELEIFRAVHAVNERQKRVLFDKMKRHFGDVKGKTIAFWGLSFKPETDDMREAPSVALIEALLAAGARVRAYDPVALTEAKHLFGEKIAYFDNAYDAANGADALAILTEWNEFRTPDFERLREALKKPLVFDGRNLYNPESLQYLGFTYYCIGMPDPRKQA